MVETGRNPDRGNIPEWIASPYTPRQVSQKDPPPSDDVQHHAQPLPTRTDPEVSPSITSDPTLGIRQLQQELAAAERQQQLQLEVEELRLRLQQLNSSNNNNNNNDAPEAR